jgi:hypothetical protein
MLSRFAHTLDDSRRRRFEADRRLLAERMPGLRHLMVLGTPCALADGIVQVDAGAGRYEPVQIEMRFEADYPALPPRVWERGGRWKPELDRHMFRDGEFCLGLPGVDLQAVLNEEAFGQFLDRLLVFLHDQFIFDADPMHRWPGRDWPHGYGAAYAQFAVETLGIYSRTQVSALAPLLRGSLPRPHDRCPCGSRRAYRRCHADAVRRVRGVRRLHEIEALDQRMMERLDAV